MDRPVWLEDDLSALWPFYSGYCCLDGAVSHCGPARGRGAAAIWRERGRLPARVCRSVRSDPRGVSALASLSPFGRCCAFVRNCNTGGTEPYVCLPQRYWLCDCRGCQYLYRTTDRPNDWETRTGRYAGSGGGKGWHGLYLCSPHDGDDGLSSGGASCLCLSGRGGSGAVGERMYPTENPWG